MADALHFEMSKNWDTTARDFIAWKTTFPLAMSRHYAAMAVLGQNIVKDELMAKVYSQPLPERSHRTTRTLYAVKASWTALRSTVFVDRRSFRYFYPWILEHGRAGTRYAPRWFFRDAMRKMEAMYFRATRSAFNAFLFSRGRL
jgi:hypothetical protein